MFKEQLKQLREERNLTQAQLAKELDVSQGTIGNWERGIREPDFKTVKMLADYFEVTTDYLLGHEAAKNAAAQASAYQYSMILNRNGEQSIIELTAEQADLLANFKKTTKSTPNDRL
ncbi:MAG: helix-turn-helix transcriptional regulator [Clostridiales bacterium]|nr:helix-turn-helix transcriptional regulator [Clostridiales bacterium]